MLDTLTLWRSTDGGWTRLYRDPNGTVFWELTYPYSQMQGGGPQRLESFSLDELRLKYPDVNLDL